MGHFYGYLIYLNIFTPSFPKDPDGFHCECPEGPIFGRFCQVRAPEGCQGENVREFALFISLFIVPNFSLAKMAVLVQTMANCHSWAHWHP
jgi:hypothetical protein